MVLQSNPPAPSFLHMQRVPRIAVSVAVGSEIFFQKGTIQDWQWHCNVDSPPPLSSFGETSKPLMSPQCSRIEDGQMLAEQRSQPAWLSSRILE